MKYNVKFSCGHEETVDLGGKVKEREKRIAWYEKYGMCKECYREQEKAKGMSAIIGILDNKLSGNGEPLIAVALCGNTYDSKDKIKALGFKWSSIIGYSSCGVEGKSFSYSLLAYDNDDEKQWVKTIPVHQFNIEDISAELKELNISNVKWNGIDKMTKDALIERAIIKTMYTKCDYVLQKEINKQREERVIPITKPQILKGKYWNGKFYGKNKRTIYLNEIPITLSDDEYKSIISYLKHKDDVMKDNEANKNQPTDIEIMIDEKYKKLLELLRMEENTYDRKFRLLIAGCILDDKIKDFYLAHIPEEKRSLLEIALN